MGRMTQRFNVLEQKGFLIPTLFWLTQRLHICYSLVPQNDRKLTFLQINQKEPLIHWQFVHRRWRPLKLFWLFMHLSTDLCHSYLLWHFFFCRPVALQIYHKTRDMQDFTSSREAHEHPVSQFKFQAKHCKIQASHRPACVCHVLRVSVRVIFQCDEEEVHVLCNSHIWWLVSVVRKHIVMMHVCGGGALSTRQVHPPQSEANNSVTKH